MAQLLRDTRPVHRRQVAWDPSISRLTVGQESAVIPGDAPGNETILRSYLDLVSAQRKVSLDHSVILRRDDIVVLAELLDLDDDHLEADLISLLHITPTAATRLHRRLLGRRIALGALGIGMLAGIPLSQAHMGTVSAGEQPTSATLDIGEASVTYAPLDASPAATPVVVTAPPASGAVAAPPDGEDEAAPDDAGDSVVTPAPARTQAPIQADGVEAGDGWADGEIVEMGPPQVVEPEPQPAPADVPTEIGEADVVEREDYDREREVTGP